MGQFFNYVSRVVEDWWGCRSFLRGWWQKNERDRRWVPPSYNAAWRALVRRDASHIARHSLLLMELHAVERPSQSRMRQPTIGDGALTFSAGEVRVGQLALLMDAEAGTAHALMLEVANDDECLERLLAAAGERAAEAGCGRLLVGGGLLPAFPPGILADHFHLDPPLHSAYNAPFLPDLLAQQCEPLFAQRIWQVAVPSVRPPHSSPPALSIAQAPSERLAGDLCPLVGAIWAQGPGADTGLRPPDKAELAFLLEAWQVAPLALITATFAGEVVGFLLLQADVGPAVRWARGGYSWWGRARLALRPPRQADRGRILLGGVAPESSGLGVGSALWAAGLDLARSHGWKALDIGPVPEGSPLEEFLSARGAVPKQRSIIFATGDRLAAASAHSDIWF